MPSIIMIFKEKKNGIMTCLVGIKEGQVQGTTSKGGGRLDGKLAIPSLLL